MIMLLTGTPGTGKTSISKILSECLNAKLVHINDLVEEKNLFTGIDPQREYKIVEIDNLTQSMDNIIDNLPKDTWIIFDGHLSHYYPKADIVIVLRTHPEVLEKRLEKRGWKKSKIYENLESEAIDLCAWEAYEKHGDITQELDTTELKVQESVKVIIRMINGYEFHPVGQVNFLDYLPHLNDS